MSQNNKNIKADEGQQLPRAQRARFSSTSLVKTLTAVFSVALLLWIFRRPFVGGFTYNPEIQAAEKGDPLAKPSFKSPNINSPNSRCSLPTTRYDIQTGITACYPSSGGIWLADLGPVELQYLGINRFDSTERSLNKAEEDHFCHELRKFGGAWYNPKSPDDLWVGGECSELDEFEPVFSIERRVAFPEKGGVWVLGRDEKTVRFPLGMAGVQNSLTMEERSMALEKLGADYCDDVAECPLLDDLKKEPFDLADGLDI
ncbi:uncharacterized protein N7473_006966 [Penicillium subrubescens]|jgi:hypothetical protein|uniref:Uncharacterized protein n=1 Tax=Penicillium subrubescens TaxID=1316194 RepID=A0A1Q5TFZ7_9EURO|nr:uncharacterized protein N7473_006966 [Penicillium subrubescens]KAJ5890738.1 hypothetical protein N7473_006966 [Penicillium subrubescens]OKO99159.1 hypothetical protein PENSUB_8546 [Penicillium subrubescens]